MQIEWKIFDVLTEKVGEEPYVVTTIRFAVVCNNLENIGEAYGTASIQFDETTQFIEYADLTEIQLLEWVKSTLSAQDIVFYEDIAKDRSHKIQTTVKQDLPWQINLNDQVAQIPA